VSDDSRRRLTTAREFFARELVVRRVVAAARRRLGRRWTRGEEVAEEVDGVGEVEVGAVVRVRALHTDRGDGSEEEVNEDVDDVGRT